MRVALIDYRAGNLTSVRKALRACGADVWSPNDPRELADAAAIIVPGVGHFNATRMLDDRWRRAILDRLDHGGGLLGICLGMQWLYEGSDEAPDLTGLGLLKGQCFLLGAGQAGSGASIKVPHVGWNSLHKTRGSSLLDGVADGAQVYFTHSFAGPVTGETAATTDHGAPFASVVERGRVFGVQFHPEKSGDVGLTILQNFLCSRSASSPASTSATAPSSKAFSSRG